MNRPILAAAIALLIVEVGPAQAQFSGGAIHPIGSRGDVVRGGSPYFGGLAVRPRGFALGYGRPLFVPGLGLWSSPYAPLGWGGLLGPVVGVVPAPIIVVAPHIVVELGVNANPEPPPPAKLPPAVEDDIPRGAKPGDHLVIRPNKPLQPMQPLPQLPPPDAPRPPPKPEPVERAPARAEPAAKLPRPEAGLKFPRPEVPAPKAKAPAIEGDPFAAKKPVNVEKVDPDPVKELARLMKLGKEAFAAGEYGAASEQFERASAADRKKATPFFLKAQAAFAAGRYADAVAAIRSGLELDRTWPASPFDPKELYGANPAPFAEHLAALRAAVAANPREPTLEFLLGYELWFVGDKVEAKKWFELAEKRLPDPGPLELFK